MNEARVGYLPASMTPNVRADRGEWYVSRPFISLNEWGENSETHQYLHADGKWRLSTFTDDADGEHPTGYFATEDDAKAALANALGKVE